MLEAYIAITFISDIEYETSRFRVPEYLVAYVLNRLEQLARGLTSTTDKDAETANPYPDSLSEQVFGMLTEYVRLARHRDIEVNMQRLCNLGAAAGGIGFFFLHEEIKRMLQGRELHPLDEIQGILENAKAEYEANNQKPPTGNEVKEGPNDYRAFVLEKLRGFTPDEKGVEIDDEVCIDSGASIHIERNRLSTSK
jgi:hypothetical protein